MNDLKFHLAEDGELLVDLDALAGYLPPDFTRGGVGPSAVVKRVKVQLKPDLCGIGRLRLQDAGRLLEAWLQVDSAEADTRSRYQRYLDNRRQRRRELAEELGRQEREKEEAEQRAIKAGLHAQYLADRAQAEEVQRRRRERFPEAPDQDLELTAFIEAGEDPPEPEPAPPPPPDNLDENEGSILHA